MLPPATRSPAGHLALPLVAALLTIVARVLVVLSRMDEQELELYSGSLAWALLQGVPVDPEALPVIPHNRGSVVFGVVLAPLFALLGPTLGTIKLLALGMSAATAALFTAVLQRAAGRTAALVGALGYALLPPSFQIVDVLALASHGDSLLFTLAALALVAAGGERPLTWRRAPVIGLTVGFACFFSFQCLVAVPALLLVWWRAERGFWRKPPIVGVVALTLVWVPLAQWMVPSGAGTTIVNQSVEDRFLPGGVGAAFEKLGATLAVQLRSSWLFELFGGAWAAWPLFVAIAAGGVLVLAGKRRTEPVVLFFLAYPALVIGAYAATNFQMKLDDNLDGMGSRYLMPALPFLVGWVALAAQGLVDRGRAPWAVALVLLPLSSGAVGLAALAEPHWAWTQPAVRGTEFPLFHGHVEHAGGDDLGERLAWVERVDPDWPELRPLAHRAFARREWTSVDGAELLARSADVHDLAAELQPYVFAELGRTWAARALPPVDVAAHTGSATPMPGATRWLLRGYGAELLGRLIARAAQQGDSDPDATATFTGALRQLEPFPPESLAAIVHGMGFQLGLRLTPYQPSLLRVVRGSRVLSAELGLVFHRAMGAGYRVRFREEDYAAPETLRVEAALDPAGRAAFRSGLVP